MVKVKEYAPDLLRKALPRPPVHMIAAGDYQAAEKKLEVSRRMLLIRAGLPDHEFITTEDE